MRMHLCSFAEKRWIQTDTAPVTPLKPELPQHQRLSGRKSHAGCRLCFPAPTRHGCLRLSLVWDQLTPKCLPKPSFQGFPGRAEPQEEPHGFPALPGASSPLPHACPGPCAPAGGETLPRAGTSSAAAAGLSPRPREGLPVPPLQERWGKKWLYQGPSSSFLLLPPLVLALSRGTSSPSMEELLHTHPELRCNLSLHRDRRNWKLKSPAASTAWIYPF